MVLWTEIEEKVKELHKMIFDAELELDKIWDKEYRRDLFNAAKCMTDVYFHIFRRKD